MVISLWPLNVDSAHCETIPLTINLSLFETHHLLEMREWEASPDLVVHVANHCSVPAPLMPGVPKVLEDLTSIGHVAGLAADAYADDSDHMAVLKHLLQHVFLRGLTYANLLTLNPMDISIINLFCHVMKNDLHLLLCLDLLGRPAGTLRIALNIDERLS